MGMVAPGRSRVVIEHQPGIVRAVVRVRRNWGVGALLALWLCAWAVGEVAVIRQLATRTVAGPLRRTREYELAAVRNPREDLSLAGAMLRRVQLSFPAPRAATRT